MATEFELKFDEQVLKNSLLPKKREVKDANEKVIQTIEISDDNLITIVKTNFNGL